MKRLLLLFTVILGLSWPAQAQDVEPAELVALATYFPADTLSFGVIRVDEAFIEELYNDLLVRGAQVQGETQIPSFEELLEEPISPDYDATFGEVLAWLGDTIASGTLNVSLLRGTAEALSVVALDDSDAALDFLETYLDNADVPYDSSRESGGTLLETRDTAYWLNDEVMLVGTADVIEDALEGWDDSLLEDSDLLETMEKLPAEVYNALFYLNGEGLAPLIRQLSSLSAAQGIEVEWLYELMGLTGSQVIGFTVLDGVAFTVDSVTLLGDSAARDAANILPERASPAIDMDFAEYIPANASLVIMDTDFGGEVDRVLDLLPLLVLLVKQSYEIQGLPDPLEDLRLTPRNVRQRTNDAFEEFTGLSLNDDIVPTTSGDYAIYLRFLFNDDGADLVIDAATIFENTDPDLADQFLEGVEEGFDDQAMAVERDDDLLVLPDLLRDSIDLPSRELRSAAFDFVVGANESVLGVGSRRAVEYSLNPDGDSLADTETFDEAARYFLGDTEMLWYVNGAVLREALLSLPSDTQIELGVTEQTMVLLHSASITRLTDGDSDTLTRMVLMLWDE
jgi:hypothetical protein